MELYKSGSKDNYSFVTYPLQYKVHSGKEYFTRSKMESYGLVNGAMNIIFLPDRGIFTDEQEFPTLNVVNCFDVKPDGTMIYASYFKSENKSEIRLVNDSGEDIKIFDVPFMVSSVIQSGEDILVLDRYNAKIWIYSDENLEEYFNTEELVRPNCFIKTDLGVFVGDKYHIWLLSDHSVKQKIVTLQHNEEEEEYHGKGVISMELVENSIIYLFDSDSLYSTREIYQFNMETYETKKIITENKMAELNIGHGIEGFYTRGKQIIVWTEDQFSEPFDL